MLEKSYEYVIIMLEVVMGKKREVLYENGRYCGKYLDTQTCKRLESLQRLSNENGYIEDLKYIIYDLPPSTVDLIKTSKSNELAVLEKGRLENHQTIGVAYMYFAKRLVLGDSVGLGKTVEVAGLCNLIESDYAKDGNEFRFLMLTGKTLVPQIRDKMIKFTGNYVESVFGEKQYVKKFVEENINELQYSVVGSHSLMNSVEFQQYIVDFMDYNGYFPFDIVIIDESGDVLTNTATQTYKNGMSLIENCERVILLNATPFERALRQFYAQINFVDDSLLPTKTDFSKEFEVMEYGIRPYPVFNGKYKNGEKFRGLVGYRYFARTRKSLGAEFRDCTAELVISDTSPIQKKLMKIASMPLMAIDCPSYFNGVGYSIETNEETTPKVRDLLKLLRVDLRDVDSILVYARYKESHRAIKGVLDKAGITCEVMNGETPSKMRENYINSFILGDIRVLITNVQKGLDFGSCNYCIFYDYDPNPNQMVQFEGRMTRSRDIVGKHVYLLVSKGRELKGLKEIVADRARASDLFSGSDFSCILSLLMEEIG